MTDEVDEIVAAWAAARPDLMLAPMQVLSRVRRLAQLLDDQREQAFAEHGLAAHEFDVLAALRRSGPAAELTPGRLIEATHVTSGTMTNRLDRLADRRLITRRPHPSDGRQTLVRLTAAGRKRVDRALESLLGYEAELVATLNERELAVTVKALRTLLSNRATNA
ncbi:MarR family winged helix-turn-helix transcriptional regulator [Jatrophihabitans sp. DSM 45814]